MHINAISYNLKNNETVQQLEQQLGYRIQDFDLRSLYDSETCNGLSVRIVPVQSIEEIAITGIIKNDLLKLNINVK